MFARHRVARAAGATALATVLAIAATLGAAQAALAHDDLAGAEVVTSADDGTVTGVRLQFSNEIIAVGTEVVATSADGTSVADGAPEVSGRDVVQDLTTPLPAGTVTIAWRVVSSDGHPITGALALTIDGDGRGALADAESETGTTASSSPANVEDRAEPGLPQAAVIGIVVGVLAMAIVALITVVGLRRRPNIGGTEAAPDSPSSE